MRVSASGPGPAHLREWSLMLAATLALALGVPEGLVAQSRSTRADSSSLPPGDTRPSPFSMVEGDRRFIVAGPRSGGMLDGRSAHEAMRELCPAHAVPPHDPDPARQRGSVTLVAVPVLRARTALDDCERSWNSSAAAPLTGRRFGSAAPDSSSPPLALRLVIDEDSLTTVAEPLPSYELSDSLWRRAEWRLVSSYDAERFAPRADGSPHQLSVYYRDAAGGRRGFMLPVAVAEGLMHQANAARIAGTSSPDSVPLRLQPRHQPVGQVGDAMFAAVNGRTGEAAVLAADLLAATPDTVGSADGALAAIVVAEAFVRRGDIPRASAVVAGAVRRRSCLVPPDGASDAVRRVARDLRLAADCAQREPFRALWQGVLFPGLGHVTEGRPGRAMVAAGVVAAVFATALHDYSKSQAQYLEYQVDTRRNPGLEYDRAMAYRRQVRVELVAGGVLWASDALLAAINVRRHNAEIDRERL